MHPSCCFVCVIDRETQNPTLTESGWMKYAPLAIPAGQ